MSDRQSKEPSADLEFDEFDQLEDADLEYLTAARSNPEPCNWCGGRFIHAEMCVTMTNEFQPRLGFGIHAKKPLRDVPPEYLRWALKNHYGMSVEAMGAAIEVVRNAGIAGQNELAIWEEKLSSKQDAEE